MFMLHLVCSRCHSVIVPNKCKYRALNRNSSFWANLWQKLLWIVEWYVAYFGTSFLLNCSKRTVQVNNFCLSIFQLDLPFSIPFYRWLLYEDSSLGLADLATVAPEVQTTLKRLQNIVRERDEILSNPALDQETKNVKVKAAPD